MDKIPVPSGVLFHQPQRHQTEGHDVCCKATRSSATWNSSHWCRSGPCHPGASTLTGPLCPDTAVIPWGHHPNACAKLMIWNAFHLEGALIGHFPSRNRYGFEFLTCGASTSTTSVGVWTARSTNMLPHHHSPNRARNVPASRTAMDSRARNSLVLVV